MSPGMSYTVIIMIFHDSVLWRMAVIVIDVIVLAIVIMMTIFHLITLMMVVTGWRRGWIVKGSIPG